MIKTNAGFNWNLDIISVLTATLEQVDRNDNNN